MEDLECRKLFCESIIISHPKGPAQIEITAMTSGAGIWLTNEKGGPIVCICHGFDQGAQISVRSGRNNPGHDLSFNADKESARIQVFGEDANKVIVIEATELYEILAHLHRGRVVQEV